MRLLLAFVGVLCACVPYVDLREYHYDRPQTPLHAGLAPQTATQTIILRESYIPPLQQPQTAAPAPAQARYYAPPTANVQSATANAVVQNFGIAGTAHIARQQQGANGYLPPQYSTQQGSNGASQAYYNQAAGNTVSTVAASYYPQQGHQQQQQQQYYTPNVNPLTQYSQQQQQPRYVNLPQTQQQQYGQQNNYAANGQQYQQQQQQQYSAGATAASGGLANLGPGQTLPLEGKYVSQSEAGQLHSYQHQQQPVGNTRPFSRQITTCYPNGQCERVTLGPGQPDHRHQHTVVATRAKVQPTSDKCRLIAEANKAQAIANQYGYPSSNSYNYAAGGGSNAAGGAYAGGSYGIGPANSQDPHAPPRPHDRRLFPYSEIVLPNDPYN